MIDTDIDYTYRIVFIENKREDIYREVVMNKIGHAEYVNLGMNPEDYKDTSVGRYISEWQQEFNEFIIEQKKNNSIFQKIFKSKTNKKKISGTGAETDLSAGSAPGFTRGIIYGYGPYILGAVVVIVSALTGYKYIAKQRDVANK